MRAARGVATRRRADSTREALLDAATELFARRGFDGASVERIARKAGVNKAMISYHFRGKQGLYDAILDATFAPAGERLARIRGSLRQAEARLREFIDLFVETAAGRPHLPAMILREVLAGGAHLEDRSVAYMISNFQLLREIVDQGIRERTFRRVDPFLTHLGLIGSLVFFLATAEVRERWIAQGKLPAAVPATEDYVKHVKELMARGLGAAPPRRAAPKERR